MGFLDLDADTSKIPERIPEGYFRKEKAPEGFLPGLWWHVKRRPAISLAFFLLPIVILLTYFIVNLSAGSAKAGVVEEPKVPINSSGSHETDLIKINAKPNNPSQDPEYQPPPPPARPITPMGGGRTVPNGKDD